MASGERPAARLFLDLPIPRDGELIPSLQAIQEEHGYLPEAELVEVARKLGIPVSRAVGVATFYSQFSLRPRGRRTIRVCLGTACHVGGGQAILDALSRELGVAPGETAESGDTLDVVRCLSCCSLAPMAMVDREAHGRLSPARAISFARRCDVDPAPR